MDSLVMAVSGTNFMRQLAPATHNRRLGDGCHLESEHNWAFPHAHTLSLFPNILLSCPQAGPDLLIKSKSLLQISFPLIFFPIGADDEVVLHGRIPIGERRSNQSLRYLCSALLLLACRAAKSWLWARMNVSASGSCSANRGAVIRVP